MKSRWLAGSAVGLTLAALLGTAVPALAQGTVERELLELNRKLFETQILQQDPGFLLSISNESYVEVAPGGVIESREEVMTGLSAFAAVDSISIQNEEVVRSGATAIVLNRLVIHGPLGGPVSGIDFGPMSVMTVFGQDGDERWSVVSRALSPCHPGPLELGIC